MDLPRELWLIVLTYVEGFERHDIVAVARCSLFFNNALGPRLFRTVTLHAAASLQAFERLVIDAQKPQFQGPLAKLLRRVTTQVSTAKVLPRRVPVLHLVKNLAITFSWVFGYISDTDFMSNRAILAACPNVETLLIGRRCDSGHFVTLLQDRPNINRIFIANDDAFLKTLVLHQGNELHHLTHLWLNDLCALGPNGSLRPEMFPALTHIVAGFVGHEYKLEELIIHIARNLLRFSRLQRLLLLIPARKQNLKPTVLLPALAAALHDKRVFAMIDHSSVFDYLGRWEGLADVQSGGTTWTSGTPIATFSTLPPPTYHPRSIEHHQL